VTEAVIECRGVACGYDQPVLVYQRYGRGLSVGGQNPAGHGPLAEGVDGLRFKGLAVPRAKASVSERSTPPARSRSLNYARFAAVGMTGL